MSTCTRMHTYTCTWVSVCQERVRYVCHDKWIWTCSRMLKCMHTHAHCVCVCTRIHICVGVCMHVHAHCVGVWLCVCACTRMPFVRVCTCTRMHIVWARMHVVWECVMRTHAHCVNVHAHAYTLCGCVHAHACTLCEWVFLCVWAICGNMHAWIDLCTLCTHIYLSVLTLTCRQQPSLVESLHSLTHTCLPNGWGVCTGLTLYQPHPWADTRTFVVTLLEDRGLKDNVQVLLPP